MNNEYETERLFFDTVKESREKYYVKYSPPNNETPFAILRLIFSQQADEEEAESSIREESNYWLDRYPVPIMASAWDVQGDRIKVPESDGYLYSWNSLSPEERILTWVPEEFDEFLKSFVPQTDLKTIFKDIPYKTHTEVRRNAREKAKERGRANRALKWVFIFWVSLIPAGFAIFEFFGPEWIGFIALIYALWEASQAYLKLTGRALLSEQEKTEAEKKQKMEHYYYHCERNPLGFLKLKSENFAEETKQQTQEEHARLKKN